MISTVAASLAWEVWEPITLPKYDLLTAKGRGAARKALIAADPDFIALAPPCIRVNGVMFEGIWRRFENTYRKRSNGEARRRRDLV